ncbi:J domain-containing protein required for chloroplast accumulation response 1 [Acorus gramineus]|uniref:J domain-containing protein required for chloroplast accumulation response 1 n=1 Tax=Acorus gramineus TaxID=55184 RepID=A0AAV9BEF8_ACOGR|nr:J domain-containing protein required for chloroplast accumulation response 1 [Acorus gramineus]
MESLSQRERILLGYASPSLKNPNSPQPQQEQRKSEVDFNDVFGGPPRRSSVHETHRVLANSLDSYTLRFKGGDGEEEGLDPRPWSSLSEKPVFGGEVVSPIRRKNLGEDFFYDIFKGGGDSVSGSPRRSDRDPFGSSPGSRVLSPSRSMPFRSETFVGGPSLPTQLSFSTRLRKGVDSLMFDSPTRRSFHKNDDDSSDGSSIPPSPQVQFPSFASQATKAPDSHLSYRQSPLSRQFFSHEKSPIATKMASQDAGDLSDKDPITLEAYNRSSHFHFSIHKWANKGVALMMPERGRSYLSSKQRSKNESRVSALPVTVLQAVNIPFPDDDDLKNECFSSGEDDINLAKTAERVVFQEESLKNVETGVHSEEGIKSRLEQQAGKSYVQNGVNINKKVPISPEEENKPESKDPGRLPNADSDRKDVGEENITKQSGEKEGMPMSNNLTTNNSVDSIKVKKRTGRKAINVPPEVTRSAVQDVPLNSEGQMIGSMVKGKVKEFIKIFSPGTPSKSTHTVESLRQRSKRRDMGTFKVDGQAGVEVDKADKENEDSNGRRIRVDQNLKQADELHFDPISNVQQMDDSLSERNAEKNKSSASCSESTPESFETTFGYISDSHCEDFEGNFVVEHLSEEAENEQSQTNDDRQEIQIADAKIQEWSKGKQGNIRSLLSTLQYVLWPKSGWKPVPLVDIVEDPSVKRVYQKALLCLHPDKLQQRGAALHQKYIAEKVFDILQEAWDQFSSVSL